MLYEVILDSGETPNKCTIAPLGYRPDFRIMRVANVLALGPLSSTVLLHPDGVCLSEMGDSLGQITGIASIDCIWRRLPGLIRRISGTLPTLAKIPSGFVTAYPRKSSDDSDPKEGLATIEALFIASALLGRWDSSLLSEYYFGRRFIELNSKRLIELGVKEVSDEKNFPPQTFIPRHSKFRRWNRGKALTKG